MGCFVCVRFRSFLPILIIERREVLQSVFAAGGVFARMLVKGIICNGLWVGYAHTRKLDVLISLRFAS